MTELSEEQKLLIKGEVERCLDASKNVLMENEKVQFDLSIYKWIFRGLFTAILGGSIAGVLLIPGWIDKLISARINTVHDLTVAGSSMDAGNFAAAYDALLAFISGLGTKADQTWDLTKLTDSQRIYFFNTLLPVLAYNSGYDPSNLSEFRGKDRWKALLKNPDFQKIFPADERGFSASQVLNLAMGFGFLRYGDTEAEIDQAYQYLHYYNSNRPANRSLYPDRPEYSVTQVEGLALWLLGRKDEAIRTMAKDASFIQSYSPYELSYQPASAPFLLGNFNAHIFRRLWKKFSKDDYDREICSIIRAAYVASISTKHSVINGPKETADFLKKAMKTYAQVKELVRQKNYDSIYEMLEYQLTQQEQPQFNQLLSRVIQLDTDHMSASIYTGYQTLTSSVITVRFFPVSSPTDLAAKEACSGLNPLSNKEEFWSFYKRDANEQEWKIYVHSGPPQ